MPTKATNKKLERNDSLNYIITYANIFCQFKISNIICKEPKMKMYFVQLLVVTDPKDLHKMFQELCIVRL